MRPLLNQILAMQDIIRGSEPAEAECDRLTREFQKRKANPAFAAAASAEHVIDAENEPGIVEP